MSGAADDRLDRRWMRGDSVLNAAVFEVFEAAGVPAASRDNAIELAVPD